MNMKITNLLLVLTLSLVGCNSLKKVLPQYEKDKPAQSVPALPNDYKVTGTTTSNFDFIPIRVANSLVTVRVNRASSPEKGWHECDQFEVFYSSSGTQGVRLWYLNLAVGGVSVPLAPIGTEYEIRSVLIDNKSSHELY